MPPDAPSGSSLRFLLRSLAPAKAVFGAGAALSLAGGVAGLFQPLMAKDVISSLGEHGPSPAPFVLLALLVVAAAALTACGEFLLERTAETIVLGTRKRLIHRILCLKVDAVARLQPGDLLTRVTSDAAVLRQTVSHAVTQIFSSGLLILGCITLMAFTAPLLMAVTAGALLLVALSAGVALPRMRESAAQVQQSVGALGAVLEPALSALRTVKAFGAEGREAAAAERAAERAWRHGVKAAGWRAVAGTAMTVSVQTAFLAVLGVGGAQVASGDLSSAGLVAFLLYLFYVMQPLDALVQALGTVQVGLAAVQRLEELDGLPAEDPGPARTPAPPLPVPRPAAPLLTLDDVSFRYDTGHPVLTRISLQVPHRGLTALVGPSGSGKSTVLALLERFHEPVSGHIRIHGRDVAGLPLHELRRRIGYVEQDSPLLCGTLLENVCYGLPGTDRGKAREVLGRVGLTGLLDRLPEGLDTPLGSGGTAVSGGERQRVAIARALARDPELLLLDEVTSGLDAASEKVVMETVRAVSRSTAVVLVSHRMSSVKDADAIVVLNDGRLLATGTHDELLGASSFYRELAGASVPAG
ncbi:ABC transporter ATP-binding protein [Streptomyces sp. NPDC046261]|uniref:ABC transporter ATP-binding protein n=1 Tax=Streptomyces sp. NPDC046261 TaxID=3157200 RepID=UPI0033D9A9F5